MANAALTPLRLARYRYAERSLKNEAHRVGHRGDRADEYVYLALADRLATRPAPASTP
jgi:hypothetical protein